MALRFKAKKGNTICNLHKNDCISSFLELNTVTFIRISEHFIFSKKNLVRFCQTLQGLKYQFSAPKSEKVPARSDLDYLFKAKMEAFRGNPRKQRNPGFKIPSIPCSLLMALRGRRRFRKSQNHWYSLQIIGDFGWLAATATVFI